MFNFLKKTWGHGERKSESPAVVPSLPESNTVEQPHHTPPPDRDPPSPRSPLKSGSKRSREDFDVDPRLPATERPLKAAKTSTFDSIRNHLPEIIDINSRDDAVVPLSLSALKEQIFEHAKKQNSEIFFPLETFCVIDIDNESNCSASVNEACVHSIQKTFYCLLLCFSFVQSTG